MRQALGLQRTSSMLFEQPLPTVLCMAIAALLERLESRRVQSLPIRIGEQVGQNEVSDVTGSRQRPVVVNRFFSRTSLCEL